VPYGVSVQPDNAAVTAAKSQLRERLIAARRARSDDERRAARVAITGHLLAGLGDLSCVAAYLPLPTEPLARELLDHLAAFTRVMVPVVTGAAPLDWCSYPVPVQRGALGIDDPVGDRLGPDAIGRADAILVPALAVDRRGHRLGRGGGHYDRSLDLQARLLDAAPGSPSRRGLRIAVVYDDELLDSVPFDDLDQPVDATVTPMTGLRSLT